MILTPQVFCFVNKNFPIKMVREQNSNLFFLFESNSLLVYRPKKIY